MSALTDQDRVLLVALADGTLEGRRRDRAEALVRTLPDGERVLARQRRVRAALGGDAATRRAPAPTGRAPARHRTAVRSPWPLRIAPLGAVAVVVALVLALLQGGGSLVSDAAALAQAPATGPAPAADGPVLRAEIDGVVFPNWESEFGWRQSGTRDDRLGGRATRTVFYEHMGHRIGYTIVSGPPVKAPSGAEIVRRDGLRIALTKQDGRDVAIFERDGHTCVLAGHVMHRSTLVKLAAWTGDV